ncbi:MAG: N-acetyltransferase [Hyphomicrobium sp.]|nr:N-acetyltransferase [Hyphomicrobium sp.]
MLASTSTRPARADDEPAISRLHSDVLGPGRFARSAYRVREGKGRLSRFCRVVEWNGQLVAALRMTEVTIGGVPGAALLGPIVVSSNHQSQGFGRLLIRDAIDAAREAGLRLVILVGDEPYYGRFGFQIIPEAQIVLPGPANPNRLLALEIEGGALARYRGVVAAVSGGSLSKAAG